MFFPFDSSLIIAALVPRLMHFHLLAVLVDALGELSIVDSCLLILLAVNAPWQGRHCRWTGAGALHADGDSTFAAKRGHMQAAPDRSTGVRCCVLVFSSGRRSSFVQRLPGNSFIIGGGNFHRVNTYFDSRSWGIHYNQRFVVSGAVRAENFCSLMMQLWQLPRFFAMQKVSAWLWNSG